MAVATRVPATFKIAKETKRRVDLMASALGVDKSKVIDEAVKMLAERRKTQMSRFLDEARESFGGSSESPSEGYTEKRRSQKYAGGPVV